ncbi:hypothetical protein H8B09_28655 [Paenibacillus sp. PR3]|uniref:SbsA Ig-like domain-containing protein n=1 Tax=Paenibacillus terricola TaxID=2763503 RepID=A0ABR8N8B8_9BACL|nr:hypothetical protein [Paenibacillus terricola]MBD3922714.1 hypothetical protein [Paenibacillus terricola]
MNGAAGVDLGEGIEIDFGRRITPTTNSFDTLLVTANTPIGSDDGYVGMTAEKKGNRIRYFPNYDLMNTLDEVIESGQKYQLIIGDGEFRDDIGNINRGFTLEFITK